MDDTGFIIIAAVIGIAIWFWILFEIIRSATRATKQFQLLEIQIRLLAELLSRQGVEKERIDEIIDLKKKYFQK